MNRKLSMFLLLACAVGFVLGIVDLFKLRFESGDVYPPYSSLRNDPLGTSAFYEALTRMPDTTCSRDYSDNNELPEGRDTAYLHLAGDSNEWTQMPESSFKVVDRFVRTGGRLVITFFPKGDSLPFGARPPGFVPPPPSTNSSRVPPARPTPKQRNQEEGFEPTVSLAERWGLAFDMHNLKQTNQTYIPEEAFNAGDPALPPSVTWHSGAVFTNLDPSWRAIYLRGKAPVLIERKLGRGSVVFATDTYFLSNEAMAGDRHAELLAWLIGPSRQVVFDEAHLGIVQQGGVATLVRKYQLGGFVAALLFLAALFIWKNSMPLAPLNEETSETAMVAGKDSAAGFVNLLRRHIRPRDVLHVCLTEWQKSGAGSRYSPIRLARAQAVIDAENARPAPERNIVRTYREICHALNERSVPTPPQDAATTISAPNKL